MGLKQFSNRPCAKVSLQGRGEMKMDCHNVTLSFCYVSLLQGCKWVLKSSM